MGIEIGTLYVRRSAWLRATPDRVWREFTSFDRLAAWFGRGHRLEAFEPRIGGAIELSVEMGGGRRAYGGRVLVFDPGHELSFSNNWNVDAWPVDTLLTLRLRALYEGCLVELFHHGFERLGADAGIELRGYEAGWGTNHLDALREIVEQ